MWALYQLHFLSENTPLLYHCSLHGLQGHAAPGASFPLPLSLLSVPRHFFLSLHCWMAFYPLKVCFPRRGSSLAARHICAHLDLLELTGTDCVWHGAARASSHWGHPCSPQLTNPAVYTQYNI